MSENHYTTPNGAVRDERGASLVEYALLVALIAVVLISAVSTFGTSIGSMYSGADDALTQSAQG